MKNKNLLLTVLAASTLAILFHIWNLYSPIWSATTLLTLRYIATGLLTYYAVPPSEPHHLDSGCHGYWNSTRQ
jgi:hypothetical protein